MRFHWSHPGSLVVACLLLLAGPGCSGVNTTHSVSPATFLIPGLMKARPSQAIPPGVESWTPAGERELALAR